MNTKRTKSRYYPSSICLYTFAVCFTLSLLTLGMYIMCIASIGTNLHVIKCEYSDVSDNKLAG